MFTLMPTCIQILNIVIIGSFVPNVLWSLCMKRKQTSTNVMFKYPLAPVQTDVSTHFNITRKKESDFSYELGYNESPFTLRSTSIQTLTYTLFVR